MPKLANKSEGRMSEGKHINFPCSAEDGPQGQGPMQPRTAQGMCVLRRPRGERAPGGTGGTTYKSKQTEISEPSTKRGTSNGILCIETRPPVKGSSERQNNARD